MDEKWIETLIQFSLFSGISRDELPHTLRCLNAKIKSYKKGEYVAIADTAFDGIGLVLFGEVAIVKETVSGNRNILAMFKSREMFGEVIAFSEVKLWPATVIAQSDSHILYLQAQNILGFCDKLCTSHQHLIANMLKIISKKTLVLNKKIEYLSLKSMRGKLSKYLLEQYKKSGNLTFSMTFNREELADFLNVSRPSMSRELGKMRDEGILEFYKVSLKILDLAALKSMLE